MKFDFLGLKTLTVIQNCLDLVNRERATRDETPLELENVSLDDVDVYKMISAADVTGVFQLESSGFRELLKKLKPDCFEDIVAAGALYRPGPLEGGMVDDFIERKHGRKRVEYDHPLLEPILKDTYGVIVYQEQVMQISSALAGYTPGQGRPAAPRDGEEEGRGHGQGEGRLPRRRQAEGRRRQDRRTRLRPDGEVRRLRLQPQPLGGLRPAHVPDRVSQALLPRRVLRGAAHLRQGRHRRGGEVHRRGQGQRHRRAAPRRQRIGHGLLGGEGRRERLRQEGDPLRPRAP